MMLWQFASLLVVGATLVASQSLNDRIEATFKLCCLRNGVPAEIATAMCTYKYLKHAGTDKDSTQNCYWAKYWQYIPVTKFCQIDGTDDRDCVRRQGITAENEICIDTLNTGEPINIRKVMQNEQIYRQCWDLWAKGTTCARDNMLAQGGHRVVFTKSFTQTTPRTCDLNKKTRNDRRVFLKLCEKSLGVDFWSDQEQKREDQCNQG